MKIVWITGARGFIGRHLSHYVSNQGAAVYGIGYGKWYDSEADLWGIKGWIDGEVNTGNLDALCRLSGAPDSIFHLAGGASVGASLADPLKDFNRSVKSGAQLFDWIRCNAPQASVVIASSAAVYGAGHAGPIPVNTPLDPYSPYGHHKSMLEQICRSYAESYATRSVIVRLFSVYGPWLRKQLMWDICGRLKSGEKTIELGGTGQEQRDWTEISDVVRILSEAAEVTGTDVPVIDGGTGTATSVEQIARNIVSAWGSDTDISFSRISRPGDPFSLVSEPCEIRGRKFAWNVPVSGGIQRYVEWFRSNAPD